MANDRRRHRRPPTKLMRRCAVCGREEYMDEKRRRPGTALVGRVPVYGCDRCGFEFCCECRTAFDCPGCKRLLCPDCVIALAMADTDAVVSGSTSHQDWWAYTFHDESMADVCGGCYMTALERAAKESDRNQLDIGRRIRGALDRIPGFREREKRRQEKQNEER